MSWIDTLVVGIVILGGLFIFYRALKEPLDDFFHLIGRGITSIREKIQNRDMGGYEIISYG